MYILIYGTLPIKFINSIMHMLHYLKPIRGAIYYEIEYKNLPLVIFILKHISPTIWHVLMF